MRAPCWRAGARACRRSASTLPPAVAAILSDPANETPKPDDPAFASAEYRIIATPAAVAGGRGGAGRAGGL